MILFLMRRLCQAVLVMFIISAIGFAIQGGLGDPVQQRLGAAATETEA